MKSYCSNRFLILAQVGLVSAFTLTMGGFSHAATFYWDGTSSTNDPNGGNGAWDTVTSNWDQTASGLGVDNTIWPASGTDNDAVFGGTTGTVTNAGVTVNDITFNTTGYTVQSNTLTLNGATPTITTGTGITATISSVIAGGSLTKAGAGTLTLTGTNTYSGGTTINASSGILSAELNTTKNALGTGAVSVGAGSTLLIDNNNISGSTPAISNTITGAGTLKLNFAAGATVRGTTMNNVTGFTGSIQLSNSGINGDKLVVASLGAINAALVIDSGSQLYLTGATTFTNGITVSGVGNNETRGAIRMGGGTLGGNVTLAGSTTFGTEVGSMTGNITSGAVGTQTLTLGAPNSGGSNTFSGAIGGGTGSIAVTVANGTQIFSGGTANIYTGGTLVTDSKQLVLSKTAGVAAVPGNIILNANADVWATTNNQFGGANTVVSVGTLGGVANFTTNGTTQTIAGINSASGLMITNSSPDGGGPSTATNGTVLLAGAGTYSHGGWMWDRWSSGTGTLSLTLNMAGGGVQTLIGTDIFYTGATTVNTGTLKLTNVTAFNSSVAVASAGVLELNSTAANDSNADWGYTKTLSGSGTINKTGTGWLHLNTGVVSMTAGQINVQGGILSNNSGGTTTWTGNASSLDVSAGAFLALFGSDVVVNALTGAGTVVNGVAGTKTLTVGNGGGSGTFTGLIKDTGGFLTAGGTVALSKTGAGIQTLTSVNTYTGATTVIAGTLSLGTMGSLSNSSSITVAGGATFDVSSLISQFTLGAAQTLKGKGTVTGSVTVATDIGVLTAGDGVDGSLTINGNLTFNGAADVNIGTLANYTAAPALNVSGTVITGGAAGDVYINLPTAPVAPGTYHLISHANTLANLDGYTLNEQPALGGRQSASLANNAGFIDYVVTGANPHWTGALNSEWSTANLASPKNWALQGGGATDYQGTDAVLFDDNATGTTTVNVTEVVSPVAVTFNNTSKNYTLQGSFAVAGTAALVKSGSGMLTITNANTYTGTTTITAGTLQVGAGSNSGSLGTGTVTNNAALVVDRSGTLTIGNLITGTGNFTLNGTSTLTLTSANTYSGATTVNGGTLTLTNTNTFSGPLTINGGRVNLPGGTNNNFLPGKPNVIVNNGGTLAFSNYNTFGNTLANMSAVTVNSGGTVLSSGVVTVFNNLTLNSGTVSINGNDNFGTDWGSLGFGGTTTVTGTSFINVVSGNGTIRTGQGFSPTFTVSTTGASDSLTISAPIGSSTALVKQGLGTLTLSGTNTHTGGTTVSNGTLAVTAGSIIGTSSLIAQSGGTASISNSTVTIGNGGTFGAGYAATGTGTVTVGSAGVLNIGNGGGRTFVGGGNVIAPFGVGVLTVNTGGTVNVAAPGTFPNERLYFAGYGGSGTINLSGGTLATARDIVVGSGAAADGVLNFNAGTLKAATGYVANTGFLSGAMTVNIQSGGATVDSNGFNISIAPGLLNGSGDGGLTKIGAGALTLFGANTYTGATTVNAGTLVLSSSNFLTYGGGNININGPSTLSIVATGGAFRYDIGGKTITFDANGGGALTIGAGMNWVSGGNTFVTSGGARNTISGTGSFNLNFGTATFNVALGTDPTTDLLVSTGPNNNSGLVTKSGAGRMVWTAVTDYTGATTISGGSLMLDGAATLRSSGSYAGAISIASGSTFEYSSTAAQTLSGVISGAGSLIKSDSSTLTLSGTNIYTGDTTVSGGVLAVNGTSIANANKLVISGGKVNASGTEIVNSLFFGAAQQASGTWGSTGSGAAHIDNTRFSGTGVVSVTSGGGYTTWAAAHAGGGTPTQDFDGDGVRNGLEWVLGGLETTNDLAKLPAASLSGGNLVFTFLRDQASKVAGTSVSIEVGTSLITWPTSYTVGTNTAGSSAGVTVTDNLNGTDTVILTVTRAPDPVKFARLKVSID